VSGILELAIVIMLAVIAGWLTTRAWHLRNRAGRLAGVAGGALAVLL
jgi:hypothetical protein